MDAKDRIPPEEQKQYVLLKNTSPHYEKQYGWKPGIVLKRISKWYGSNGLGRHLKQTYFVPADSDNIYGHIAWNDHVEEITGQLKLDI
ncbi:hypothetical protein M5V91_14655 [Cytobacillus pseudoceanisediminis]|uniref:hypothetical protein n=1 Tax=Cytobacillus pseudoceanisediminis TaxID=3051614 RepID=UPI002189967C|nr:hypothetical protein [Cytobacillus pseudoceanisediminis]UQX52303.1 hypothetical protein M5V91_14655 [Cytobacillus pseudoceanisediminis]